MSILMGQLERDYFDHWTPKDVLSTEFVLIMSNMISGRI